MSPTSPSPGSTTDQPQPPRCRAARSTTNRLEHGKDQLKPISAVPPHGLQMVVEAAGRVGLRHGFGEVKVATDGGQHLFWCVVAVLDEQPSKDRQVLGRYRLGDIWSADELDHAARVGRPPDD